MSYQSTSHSKKGTSKRVRRRRAAKLQARKGRNAVKGAFGKAATTGATNILSQTRVPRKCRHTRKGTIVVSAAKMRVGVR